MKKFESLDDILEESYSSMGGLTSDNDIENFIGFIHKYPELPGCSKVLNTSDMSLKSVLMLYEDLLFKVSNAMSELSYKSAYHWLKNCKSFIERGDKDRACYSYQQSYEIASEALNSRRMYLDTEEPSRDITSMVEGLIEKYGVNTATNILKSELYEDTDLNTELKVTNEDGDTDTQPANNQQQNNNTQNDQQNNQTQQQSNNTVQNQVQLTEDTNKEFEEVYNKCSEFLNKYASCKNIQGGVNALKGMLDKFKNGLAEQVKAASQQQQNNNQQNQQNTQQQGNNNNQNNQQQGQNQGQQDQNNQQNNNNQQNISGQ